MVLKKAAGIRRQAETVYIESPARNSQSNGSAERAVRTWAARVRTMRHHLESKIVATMSKDSAPMTLLAAWANKCYSVQSNGRASFARITGHNSNVPIAVLGGKVDFTYTSNKNKRHKVDSDWD